MQYFYTDVRFKTASPVQIMPDKYYFPRKSCKLTYKDDWKCVAYLPKIKALKSVWVNKYSKVLSNNKTVRAFHFFS